MVCLPVPTTLGSGSGLAGTGIQPTSHGEPREPWVAWGIPLRVNELRERESLFDINTHDIKTSLNSQRAHKII